MAKPSKQFCGTEHWSGEPCKVCDGLKGRRKGHEPSTYTPAINPRLLAVAPCPECHKNAEAILALESTVAKLNSELGNFHQKAAKERAAVLERVRKSREKKAAKVLRV